MGFSYSNGQTSSSQHPRVEKKPGWTRIVAILGDEEWTRKNRKREKTIYKYVQIKVERLWQKKAKIVPRAVGAISRVPSGVKHSKVLQEPQYAI